MDLPRHQVPPLVSPPVCLPACPTREKNDEVSVPLTHSCCSLLLLFLCRAKSVADSQNSKYIVLDRLLTYDEDGNSRRPAGEMKGLLKSVVQNGVQIVLYLESGDTLELRLAQEGALPVQKRAADWAKVLQSFLAVTG